MVSLGAMGLSLFTTYLTFFDERVTLTTAIDRVSASIQRGGSSSDGRRSVTFRYYVTPAFILSLQGTRPLVLTDVRLIRSSDTAACVATEDEAVRFGEFQSIIVEPDSVRRLAAEFELERAEASDDGGFALSPRDELWCLQLTLFDHAGERREPLAPAFTAATTFAPPAEDDDFPTSALDIDAPREAVTLISNRPF
ncbi:MAG: hypothetical protein MI723_09120 [Caulobacterales bacterium]|nr:hypothetical protein [Caulobacterales bacterium]